MEEVTSRAPAEKSEIERKTGCQTDAVFVLECEGPGRDVKASHDVIGQPLGTSRRVPSDKADTRTFLVRVRVDAVVR